MDRELIRLRSESESEKKNDEKMMTKSREAERNYCRKTFVFELEMTFDTSGLAEATVKNKIEAVRKKGICSAIVGERDREREREERERDRQRERERERKRERERGRKTERKKERKVEREWAPANFFYSIVLLCQKPGLPQR